MVVKTDAIVLRAFKYGENKHIVDLFTKTNGRLSFIVTVSASGKGKLKKQLFQPLTLLSVAIDVRQKASLHKIADASINIPYVSLPFDPYKISISMFIAEFLCYALRSEQGDEPLYRYIEDSLRWLDGCGDDGFANFHIVFLMRLSRFLGFFPNLEDYSEGDCFDLRTGCFCHVQPFHTDVLCPQDAAMLRTMMRLNYQTMHLFRMSRTERNRFLDIALRYYAIHIPDFPELRSLAVLRDLFG